MLIHLTRFPYHYGELSSKLGKAMVDIRPIIRDARREAKQQEDQAKRQEQRDRGVEEFFRNHTQDLSQEIPRTAGRGGW